MCSFGGINKQIVMNGLAELRRLMTTPLGKVSYYNLKEIQQKGRDIEEFPFTIRILAENIIRNFNGTTFNRNHLDNIINWTPKPARNE